MFADVFGIGSHYRVSTLEKQTDDGRVSIRSKHLAADVASVRSRQSGHFKEANAAEAGKLTARSTQSKRSEKAGRSRKRSAR